MTPVTSFLIVHSEPRARSTVAEWLRSRQFTVAEAGTAGEALDHMAEGAAAIAVCDEGLTDRDGIWLARQMRRQFPQTALVITTVSGVAAPPSTLESNAIGYLPKPFTEQQLMQTVDWALRWRRANAG
jgi:DNA-binding response OmpR family regulator